jgi:D-glycero-D-manno-heptose 1,7-bisphosphate phosphatase
VINELCYSEELRLKCAPFEAQQFKLNPGVPEAINKIHRAGYLAILASNQPDIGLGFMKLKSFEAIRDKMNRELKAAGAYLDFEYYCMHHVSAKLKQYRLDCDCRKPKSGLLLNAAREHNIDLKQSWFIGDNYTDVEAGQGAGCRTVLLTDKELPNQKVKPDKVFTSLAEAVDFIVQNDR